MSNNEAVTSEHSDFLDPILNGPKIEYPHSSRTYEMQASAAQNAAKSPDLSEKEREEKLAEAADHARKALITLYLEEGLSLEPLLGSEEAQEAFAADLEEQRRARQIEESRVRDVERARAARRERITRLRAVGGTGIDASRVGGSSSPQYTSDQMHEEFMKARAAALESGLADGHNDDQPTYRSPQ